MKATVHAAVGRHVPLVFAAALVGAAHAGPFTMNPAEYAARIAEPNPHVPAPFTLTAAQEKMSSQLAALYPPVAGTLLPPGRTIDNLKAELLRLGRLREWETVTPPGVVDSDLLYVYVRAGEGQPLDPVRPFCFGPFDESPALSLLAGWIEEDRLSEVALLPGVVRIEPVDPPRFRAGGALTEGDVLHNGPIARGTLGVDGGPIPIGVISDGVTSLAAAQMTGDLPAVNVLTPGGGDEGTAMLEIIHDIAPGAPLHFCASGPNQATFVNAVAALATAGCKVICDDVGWYTEPYFEPSPVGNQIAGLQLLHGFVHVSAAGNDGRAHHQQVFTDSGPVDGWHDPILYANVPPGGVLDVFMQWDEALGLPPANDYDLYLYNANNLAAGPLAQGVTRNAVGETVYFTNTTGSPILAAVYVWRQAGPNSRVLEIFLEPQNGASNATNGTSAADAIFGHPSHSAVLAVVATDHRTPDTIEPDSSRGPVTHLGVVPVPPKPDATGIDQVSVTGVGGFGSPFGGTSAAAPHVAAACALAWHRSPGLPGAALKVALPFACADLPSSAPNGFDGTFGHGRPLADQWAAQLNRPPVVTAPVATIECAPSLPEAIGGVSLADPDAGAAAVIATFSVSNGMLQLNPTPGDPNGLQPHEITPGGGPGSLVATASIAAINHTLAAPRGLVYQASGPVPPGTTVAAALVIAVNDQGASGAGVFPLSGTALVPLRIHEFAYFAWQHDHFTPVQLADPAVSGDDADPDDDGYANVWEFLMGTDPWSADAAGEFQHAVSGANLVLKFRVDATIPPHWYQVQESQDLAAWNPVTTGIAYNPHPTAPGAIQVVVTYPLASHPASFLRVSFNPYQ